MLTETVYLDLARCYFDRNELVCCLQTCRRGLEQNPDSGRLWELTGLACWLQSNMPEALFALESASILVPLSPLAQLALASAYAWAEKPDLARAVYRHLTESPEFPVPLMPKLAAGLGGVGEDEAALLVCEKLVELRPNYHPAWFGVAHYRRRLGWPLDLVLDALWIAHDLAPHELTYRVNLAACLARSGRQQAAYDLSVDLPLEEIACPHWLEIMEPVFRACGDQQRAETCREVRSRLGDDCNGCR